MEIIFVTVIGAALGGIIRYLVPGRESHGLAIMPGVAAAVTAAVWAGLVWLGFTFDGGWIWVIALGAGIAASITTALVLPRVRATNDAEMLHRLSGGKA